MAVSSYQGTPRRRPEAIRLTKRRPILTPKTVLPIFYVFGLLFALFGGLMLWASTEVRLSPQSLQ